MWSLMYIEVKVKTFLQTMHLYVKESLFKWWVAVSSPDSLMTGSGAQGSADEMGDEYK